MSLKEFCEQGPWQASAFETAFVLPFDVDITGLLTREEVAVLQNHIFCVPDDDTQLIPGHTLGC